MQRSSLSGIPSVDRVLREPVTAALLEAHGRAAVVEAVRQEVDDLRRRLSEAGGEPLPADVISRRVAVRLARESEPSLRAVLNLTGVVLHTNLGRALLPAEAAAAITAAATRASNVEFDLASGRRGDRDAHVEGLLVRLTGAEAATVVNNNAAAVLLVLATLASRREVLVSRGELIEIGGSFRMPEIMKAAGCRLVEVGTTNRTHLKDYDGAIGPRTALLMKVHPSNYEIRGFTSAVSERELAALARARSLPMVSDLGSGMLVDLRRWGLPYEPTPADVIADGVDVVTFSGDKLLGGPQAGIIVGRADLLARLKRNPLKRALRLDKLTLAALEAVLRMYADPERVAERVPTLRHLTRPLADIAAQAERLLPAFRRALAGRASVASIACESQAGSGSLPASRLPSRALAIRPLGRRPERAVEDFARAFRALAVPVIGRVQAGALVFDLRCLDDEDRLLAQLDRLAIGQAESG